MTILSVFFEVISPKHTRACSSLKRWPRSLQTAWHAVCRLREVSRLHGTSTTSSSTTIKEFSRLFAAYGLPEAIVTDNGPQFTSSEWVDFMAE